MRTKKLLLCCVLACLFLLQMGCRNVKKIPIPELAETQNIKISPTEKLSPIVFAKGIVALRRGDTIGALYSGRSESGNLCNYYTSGNITWGKGRQDLGHYDSEIADIFQQTLIGKGYNVVGFATTMFNARREINKAKYEIGARIVDVTINLCHEVSAWDQRPFYVQSGEAYVKVEWSVYSRFEDKVVYTTETEGYHKLEPPHSDGYSIAFLEAFADASERLASDKGFYDLIANKNRKTLPNKVGDVVKIEDIPLSTEPMEKFPTQTLSSVVVIRAAGGHGSGFIISSDGYIITNRHVIGEDEDVRVIFYGGFELNGKVIKADSVRDVALVKVDLNNSTPMPLQTEFPKVTQETMAIGAPLDISNSYTVTKGIVSAVRFNEQKKELVIQADTPIQPGNSGGPLIDMNGNVVGISTYYFHGGKDRTTNLNFFIPIKVALRVLNIERVKQ